MRMAIKLSYVFAGVLILALLMFVQADKYFRFGFYARYLGIMLAVMLVLWLAGNFTVWKRVSSLSIGAAFIHWLGVLSLTTIIGMIVEYFLLAGLLSNSASQPRFSIFSAVLLWLGGMILFLGWHVFFFLMRTLFNGTPALRIVGIVLVSLFAMTVLFVFVVNGVIRRSARSEIYTFAELPSGKVAVVFGAGVRSETRQPTAVLQDRIKAAVELYQAGKVQQVLLSGTGVDGGIEVDVMEEYALDIGIPADALLLDPLGVRTYATCQRVRDEFGIEDVVLVTQNFHLPRALFLCDSLGVKSTGLSADLRVYSPLSRATWILREAAATAYAWLEVTFIE